MGESAGVLDGAGVLVGANVAVSAGVAVSGGIDVNVLVGGMGVSVSVGMSVSVGLGIDVAVLVGVRVGVLVGVRVGILVGVRVKVAAGLGPRVRVGGTGVHVIKMRVGVLEGTRVGEAVGRSVAVPVGVGINSTISTTVNATAVLIGLENPDSTISCGSIAATLVVPGPDKAAAATKQNRLKPKAPAVRTVKGPEYSLIFTLGLLLIPRQPHRILIISTSTA